MMYELHYSAAKFPISITLLGSEIISMYFNFEFIFVKLI
jgi:hypothetical protein